MQYNNMSDEDLVFLIQKNLNNNKALEVLLTRYRKFIVGFILKTRYAYSFYQIIDDLIHISYLKIIDIIPKYEKVSGNFYSFARICIIRHLNDHYIYSNNRKIDFSLDSNIFLDSSICYSDIISEEDGNYSLDDSLIIKETLNEIETKLTKEEFMLLQDKADGYSYQELAEKYNTTSKNIDNKLSSIRKKIVKD